MTIASTRRDLYRGARFLGDVEAASRGPAAYSRRLIRKRVLRGSNRLTVRFLRSLMG